MKILAINPGSTSTKIALFDDDKEIMHQNIAHDITEISKFKTLADQLPMREKNVMDFLAKSGVNIKELAAVAGRGGHCNITKSGTYLVTDMLLEDLRTDPRQHASTLGALIADKIAKQAGVNSYVVNPVTVDEALDICHISGVKEIRRTTQSHALNHKEVGHRAAALLGKKYEEVNLVIAHMGGGTSIAGHQKGRMIEVGSGWIGEGPFTANRAGTVDPGQLVHLCFTSGLSEQQMKDRLVYTSGLYDYLGTGDGIEIEKRIANGDEYAKLIYEAMAYQHAKEIGAVSVALYGDVDAICITGGFAHSKMITDWITERVKFIAPVMLFPGEFELEGLASGTLRVLRGQEQPGVYTPPDRLLKN
jgi:butyrate kinase